LLVLLLGVIDLGRVYFSYITVVNAAREGARYGAGHPQDLSTAQTRAADEAQGSGITLTNVTVSCPSGCTQGNPVRVVVGYSFQLITLYILGGGTIPLQATVEMEIFASP
jgi:Flp pilus assembly protein TadG